MVNFQNSPESQQFVGRGDGVPRRLCIHTPCVALGQPTITECIHHMTEFDADTPHPDTKSDSFYESLPATEKQHHDIICWWFRFLRMNPDYTAYCEAQRDGNEGKCRQLEDDFPKVKELFADFGDLHSPDLHTCGVSCKGWQRWFAGRLGIFFPDQAKLANPAYITEDTSR